METYVVLLPVAVPALGRLSPFLVTFHGPRLCAGRGCRGGVAHIARKNRSSGHEDDFVRGKRRTRSYSAY